MTPQLHPGSFTGMSQRADCRGYYLVEWYRPGLDQDEIDRIAARLDQSTQSITADGASVRRVMTMAVPAGEWMFGVFEADSAHAVELVCRHAGMEPQQLNAALEAAPNG
ncbi:hypothetical protein [Mycobacterium sp. E2327]|uniref:hypothetical protein n=1 Tax=Mycobacterium sp. E2327 TaxID=1834132 RepID=UPI0009ED7293|nr:hypothetical protein [Mycobacterium sp. E2327]